MSPDANTPAALIMAAIVGLVGPGTARLITASFSWATLICFVCSIIVATFPPPAPGGWAAKLWRIASAGAFMLRFAKGAYQPGRTAAMAPTAIVGEVRTAIAENHDIPREETKP